MFLFVVILVFSLAKSYEQAYGNIHIGTVEASFEDNKSRYGYEVGGGVVVGGDGLFVFPGIAYQRFSLIQNDKNDYFSKSPCFNDMRLSVDLGFEYKIISTLRVRFFGGGGLDYVLDIEDNPAQLNFDNVYDAAFSWQYGVGASFSILSIEYKMINGITDYFRTMKPSKLKTPVISLGFRF